MDTQLLTELEKKVDWVRRETLKLHRSAPGTRVASSLSDVEILVVLYYGTLLRFLPENPAWEDRDRIIISKGHGAISLYPILADLNYFKPDELARIAQEDSFLGVIPDTIIPGFETNNGSLGHGLGVGSGIALALQRKNSPNKVVVLSGDGELNEGAVWESIMFSSFHKLGNMLMIIDNNKMSMLGYQEDIMGLEPLTDKFRAFNWRVVRADGHNLEEVHGVVKKFMAEEADKPMVLIADTIKGKGVAELENDPLCHIKSLSADKVDELLGEMK